MPPHAHNFVASVMAKSPGVANPTACATAITQATRGLVVWSIPVIASAAKQSILSSCQAMDCFAALAMTVEYTSAFSRRDAPGVLRLLPPRKSEGAGNAGCTLHPRSHVRCASKNAAHEHTGSAEAIRHSLRNGFTAYAVLTPATNSVLVTVADGLRLVEPGRADFASASLTSATDARPTRFCRTLKRRSFCAPAIPHGVQPAL